jgi:hypothetical protein
MRRTFLALIGADTVLGLIALASGEHWLINTQIGFFTSTLVIGASMLSYARMVRQRLDAGDYTRTDQRDTLDKLEDPFELYDDETPPNTAEEPEAIREAIREEKRRLKTQRRSVAQTVRDSRPFVSFYRIGAYGALVLGFMYLQGHHLLRIVPYLIGLGVPVVVIVLMLTTRKGTA